MVRFAQSRSGAVNVLAAEVAAAMAESVAAAMDEAGLDLTLSNTMALTSALGKALESVGRERECAVRQRRIERRTAWVEEQGLLTAAEAAQHLGLTPHELDTAQALDIIAPVDVPSDLRATSEHFTSESWRYYAPNLTLTPVDHARIAHGTLLTRTQASERLGVSLQVFDDLRMEQGIMPVAQSQAQGSSRSTLYRADVVDQLAGLVPHGGMRGRGKARAS